MRMDSAGMSVQVRVQASTARRAAGCEALGCRTSPLLPDPMAVPAGSPQQTAFDRRRNG